MPTNKDLAALLGESPQPPLRRGRGLRLARASKQAREIASKPSILPEPSTLPEPSATTGLPAVESDAEAVASAALIASAASSDAEPLKPERDKRKLLLRKDLLKQCKRIARAQDRKLYQVIEAALEEYIQRHGAHE
jgi:hypothetical protein